MLSAPNTQTVVAFAQAIWKTCAEWGMHAYLSQLWNNLLAWSNDQTFDSRKEHFRSFRTRFAGRSLTSTEVWVRLAFCNHSKVWSWSLAGLTLPRIGWESDCRTARVEEEKKKVKRSMLLTWPGQVRQLASFPLCETFFQIPQVLTPKPKTFDLEIVSRSIVKTSRAGLTRRAYELEVHWNNSCSLTVRQVTRKNVDDTQKKWLKEIELAGNFKFKSDKRSPKWRNRRALHGCGRLQPVSISSNRMQHCTRRRTFAHRRRGKAAARACRYPYKNSHEFLNSHENLMRFSWENDILIRIFQFSWESLTRFFAHENLIFLMRTESS